MEFAEFHRHLSTLIWFEGAAREVLRRVHENPRIEELPGFELNSPLGWSGRGHRCRSRLDFATRGGKLSWVVETQFFASGFCVSGSVETSVPTQGSISETFAEIIHQCERHNIENLEELANAMAEVAKSTATHLETAILSGELNNYHAQLHQRLVKRFAFPHSSKE